MVGVRHQPLGDLGREVRGEVGRDDRRSSVLPGAAPRDGDPGRGPPFISYCHVAPVCCVDPGRVSRTAAGYQR